MRAFGRKALLAILLAIAALATAGLFLARHIGLLTALVAAILALIASRLVVVLVHAIVSFF